MSEEHKEHQSGDHHKEHGEHHQTKNKKSNTIAIDKLTLWKSVSAVLGILLIISIFTGGFGIKSGTGSDTVVEAQAAQPRQAEPAQEREPTQAQPRQDKPSVDMEDLVDDDDIKGDENAPVTIVEWSDYECPFCTRFYSQTLGQIKTEYIDAGKVRFVYRDFPLGFHRNAQKSAEAAECAGEQGKYYEMHDKLFEEGVSGGVSAFKQYAADIGLDTAQFDNCLDSGEMAAEVAKDMQDGQAVGITGTPGFIINGQKVSGAQPFANFKQIIDAALAG